VTETLRDRERDLERFLTFVDAVVAIAITLLVLPLAEAATEVGDGTVGHLLRENEDKLLGFFLSFVVIAQLWFAQQRTVSNLVVQDPLVTRLMIAWAMTIVFLPFPTALVAEDGHEAATKILYVGTMAVSSMLLALMAWAVGRKREIRDSDDRPDPAPSLVTVLGFAIALAITLLIPETSYYPLFLLLLTGPTTNAIRRARGGARRPTHMGE
jgi:uncharacterized membrane protein